MLLNKTHTTVISFKEVGGGGGGQPGGSSARLLARPAGGGGGRERGVWVRRRQRTVCGRRRSLRGLGQGAERWEGFGGGGAEGNRLLGEWVTATAGLQG